MSRDAKAVDTLPIIVFMGNSITQSWPDFTPDFWSSPRYINRGIGGETTDQMLERFQADVIEADPHVVVLLAGTNDIAQNNGPVPLEMVRDNIIAMCERADAHNIRVVLCSILPASDYPWRPGLQPADKIVRVNEWLEGYAREQKITYVDFHGAMANSDNGMIPDLAYDGVHPNKEGYQVMLRVLKSATGVLFD